MGIDNAMSFWREALYQGQCAVTGDTGNFHAHHVLTEQACKRERYPRHDPRNALRVSHHAHSAHHTATRKIRTRELVDSNIEFVVECMGVERGVQYLRRYYDDATEPDPRLGELCPATLPS